MRTILLILLALGLNTLSASEFKLADSEANILIGNISYVLANWLSQPSAKITRKENEIIIEKTEPVKFYTFIPNLGTPDPDKVSSEDSRPVTTGRFRIVLRVAPKMSFASYTALQRTNEAVMKKLESLERELGIRRAKGQLVTYTDQDKRALDELNRRTENLKLEPLPYFYTPDNAIFLSHSWNGMDMPKEEDYDVITKLKTYFGVYDQLVARGGSADLGTEINQ